MARYSLRICQDPMRPHRGKLRWYHRNFLSSAVLAEDFFIFYHRRKRGIA